MKHTPVHVGILSLEIFIPLSQSLKSKRRILKSLKDRIGNRFNVSVAEVDFHDKWQRAVIGTCMISNDKVRIEKTFQDILNMAETNAEFEVTQSDIEFV